MKTPGIGRATSPPLRLLFFVPTCVYPVSHGGASRITNTMWGLASRGHEVHVLSLVGNSTQQEAMRALPHVTTSEAHVIPPDRYHLPGGSVPSIVRNTHRAWVGHRMEELIREYSIDIAQLEYTQSAAYASAARPVPVVLVEHDVAFVSSFRRVMLEKSPFHSAYRLFDSIRLHHWELQHAKRVDLVLAASDREAALLRTRGVACASGAVPNGADVRSLEPRGPRREERDLLYVGSFYHRPNVDGLRYFVSEIWPSLRQLSPHLNVSIVGPGLPSDLAVMVDGLGFRYAGYVQDLAAELWSHKVFIVPIRYGAGTRIKVLEAAAAKCAMVSTSLGVEGIGLRDGWDALIADRPEEFARAVVTLLDSDDLRVSIGSSAHDFVQRHFDWPNLVCRLEELYFGLMASG
jgi:glycosyltransferase involved in cell wall biosynthesis